MPTQRITEARLNDLAYMALKRYFFEGWGMNPRECDIRIVMDMSAPERITSIANAILSPNEKAGASHTTFYDVHPHEVLETAINYMEDHWIKQEIEESIKEQMRTDWLECIPVIMAVDEESCGIYEQPNSQ